MKEFMKKAISFENQVLPSMIMLMGIPGCGKSTIAEKIQKNHKKKS